MDTSKSLSLLDNGHPCENCLLHSGDRALRSSLLALQTDFLLSGIWQFKSCVLLPHLFLNSRTLFRWSDGFWEQWKRQGKKKKRENCLSAVEWWIYLTLYNWVSSYFHSCAFGKHLIILVTASYELIFQFLILSFSLLDYLHLYCGVLEELMLQAALILCAANRSSNIAVILEKRH